ncbi:helix-turn-helix transcriptional regulator [Streptomyces chartreusis]|uniref:helix-turn-helix transcriptional regulator n=1 Tax=Streptomyces chartreusis TaxID=1969 RepID=UPI0038213B0A
MLHAVPFGRAVVPGGDWTVLRVVHMSAGENGSPWPLVGREGQMESFKQALGDDQIEAFLIYGPTGVGKSRLARECWSFAMQSGHRGSRATATLAARAMPLGAIAHLIPAGVDLTNPMKGLAALASVIGERAQQKRVVILVDDVHLLDSASAVLLRQLMDAEAVFLIGTVRASDPLSEAVTALQQGDTVCRVDLTELDERNIEELLNRVLEKSVARSTVHKLFDISAGNPLYLRELIKGALESGALVTDGGVWQLTAGSFPGTPRLRELIERHLPAVGETGRHIFELLSLCGTISFDCAKEIASPDALNQLERDGLIRIARDQQRLSVYLSHPLYGEVLRENLPVQRRNELLLEQARRVEAHGMRRRDDALNVASWRLSATGSADPSLLLEAAVIARHAHDYEQVATLLNALPEIHHSLHTCLLLSEALRELGRLEDAVLALDRGEMYVNSEHDRLVITVARTANLFWLGARAKEALEVNENAAQEVSDPNLLRLFRINEGYLRTLTGEPIVGVNILEKYAPVEVDELADVNAWLWSGIARPIGLAATGRSIHAVKWAEHAYSTHQKVDAQALLSHPAASLPPMVFALTEAGKLNEARALGESVLRQLMKARVHGPLVWVELFLGRIEWLAGNVTQAGRWFSDAIALANSRNQVPQQQLALSGLAAAAALSGDVSGANEAQKRMEYYPGGGLLAGEERLGEAWLLVAQGRLTQARDVLSHAAAAARKTNHVASEALLLTDIARLGNPRQVARRLSQLAAMSEGPFIKARAHMAEALSARDSESLYLASDELHDVGAHLLAAEAVAAAAAEFRRMGNTRQATAAASRAHDLASACDGASTTPLLAAAEARVSLTAREREVALLAAGGAPSKDIAATLHLSVRTVDNHLQHVYTKLGISTRRELRQALGSDTVVRS